MTNYPFNIEEEIAKHKKWLDYHIEALADLYFLKKCQGDYKDKDGNKYDDELFKKE